MKYLFFDIECANCFEGRGKICEFGYVLTDENFDVLEKNIFLVNPKADFDWYVIKNMLAYTKNDYYCADTYPKVYPSIKRLFDMEDTLIVGHTVDSDAKYLNDEALRYSLPYFDYTFYDAKYMYCELEGQTNAVALEKMGEIMGEETGHSHRSIDDAETTMLTVRHMCAERGVSLAGLIDLCPTCVGRTEQGHITSVMIERAKEAKARREQEIIEKNIMTSGLVKKFEVWARSLTPVGEIPESDLAGKSVCLSMKYERTHLNESLALAQILVNRGMKYTRVVSECDIYMLYEPDACDGETEETEEGEDTYRPCPRYKSALFEKEQGTDIKILEKEDFFQLLGLSEEELTKNPFPREIFDLRVPKRKSRRKEEDKKSVKV